MTWHAGLCILALLQTAPILAVPWTAAPSTTFVTETSPTTDSAPSTTSGPSTAPPFTLGNTTYEPPQLCGYVNYNSKDSYTCGGSHTCFWNRALKLVGCGHATSIDYITSCVPFRALKYCDSSCFANPSVIRCGSDLPYCVTPAMGPRGNYSILACEATRPYGTAPYRVHLTFAGQTTTGYLPRYLGEDGSIKYGTRVPKNHTSSLPSSFLIEPTSFDIVVSSVVNVGAKSSAAAEMVEGREVNRALIVGVVLGGSMLIAAVAVLGLLAWVYRRGRVLEKSEGEDEREGIELGVLRTDGAEEQVSHIP